jgi:hypothetical protein
MNGMDKLDWEMWLNEVWGEVSKKQKTYGDHSNLADWESLVDILAFSDYCIANAGDFANMEDVNSSFQSDAAAIAARLALPEATSFFSQDPAKLENHFFNDFDKVCSELKEFIRLLPNSGNVGEVSKNWKPD